MNFLIIGTESITIKIIFVVLILGVAVELVSVIYGSVSMFMENHCYSQRTKQYIAEEYESDLQIAYPTWNIDLEKRKISKKKLRQLCVSCNQNLNQRPLYSAGAISRTFGLNNVNIDFLVAVKPFESYETPSESVPAEFYTWIIFEAEPIDSGKFKMNGSFHAENCYPYPDILNSFNDFKQRMSDKGRRKFDMDSLISGGINLENNIIISYMGIKRGQWQNIVELGLCSEINQLYSILRSGFRLDYDSGRLSLALWIKMPDNEMYDGHNDFAISNADMLSSTAQKLSDIAYIIENS